MITIRVIYLPVNGMPQQPDFPATAQHPDAERYLVGDYYVDAIGGEPTLAEVEALLEPAATSVAGRSIRNGPARQRRKIQELAQTDPVGALLKKEGLE